MEKLKLALTLQAFKFIFLFCGNLPDTFPLWSSIMENKHLFADKDERVFSELLANISVLTC